MKKRLLVLLVGLILAGLATAGWFYFAGGMIPSLPSVLKIADAPQTAGAPGKAAVGSPGGVPGAAVSGPGEKRQPAAPAAPSDRPGGPGVAAAAPHGASMTPSGPPAGSRGPAMLTGAGSPPAGLGGQGAQQPAETSGKIRPFGGVERDSFRGTPSESIRLSEEIQMLDTTVEVEKKRLEIDKIRLERKEVERKMIMPGRSGQGTIDVPMPREATPHVRSIARANDQTIAVLERGGQTVVVTVGKKVWGYTIKAIDMDGVAAELDGKAVFMPMTVSWAQAQDKRDSSPRGASNGGSPNSADALRDMMKKSPPPPVPSGSKALPSL